MENRSAASDKGAHRYEMMRPQEIIAERERVPVAYVALGPMEWHGPHLPYGTDMLHAYSLALDAAERAGGVVLPPLPLGTETMLGPKRERDRGFKGTERIVGMDFPGFSLPSLYIEESAFGIIISDLVRALKRQKFRVIVLVSGHGGNNHRATLTRIAQEQSVPGTCIVLHAYGLREPSDYKGGHAEKTEVSFMLAKYRETVDLQALPPSLQPLHNVEFGVLDLLTCMGKPTPDYTVRPQQDPRFATAEEGEKDHEYGVEMLVKMVAEAMSTMAPQQVPGW
jgi:creatinine amidohydrolase